MGQPEFDRYSYVMRFSVPAAAVSLCLIPLGMVPAGPPGAPQPAAAAAPANTAPAPAAKTSEATASDAAVRHAKRTACLKEAKAKKLVGADKNSYIKDCLAGH
jgi:hypothetical protein